MKNPSPVTETDLHAYVDGALDEDRRAEVEEWLAIHPDSVDRVKAYKTHIKALHGDYDSILGEPVPVDFVNVVTNANRRSVSVPWRNIAAGIVLLLIGGFSGWTLHGTMSVTKENELGIARTAMSAHTVYVAERRHSVEVKADEEKHLFKWLSKRLGQRLYTPDLTNAGYDLVGGRLLPDDGRPAAQFMYQNSTGDRLTVYLRRNLKQEELSFRFVDEGDVSAFYWRDKSFAYALTGKLPRNKLLALAQVVHHGISPK